jgi:hypothetical protein
MDILNNRTLPEYFFAQKSHHHKNEVALLA